MRFSTALAALSLGGTALVNAADGVKIQASGLKQTKQDVKRAEEVKAFFGKTWEAYRKWAWGWDQLQPMSLNGTQTRNGWGGTIVDALDTLIIMGYEGYYKEALQWVEKIDYNVSKTHQTVSTFETTIRYLGGMLSAYHLSPGHEEVLVQKSIQLGNMLSLAWTDENTIPWPQINTTTRKGVREVSNIAEAGTLLLEFDELSRHSGNGTYLTLAQLAMYAIMNEDHVLPGMPAQGISPKNSSSVGDIATWDGGSDSYFEYLLKYALTTGNEDPRYLSEWLLAVDSLISKLIHTDSVKGLTYPAHYSPSNGGLIYAYSHLECFIGGNLLLGGAMLGNSTLKEYGLKLTETCYNSYNSTATKIGPETFCYIPEGKLNPVNGCNVTRPADQEFVSEHGFMITGADYIQRPEVVESYFYAYRITGDEVWKERAWEAFEAIRTWTKGTVGVTALHNVNKIPPGLDDDLETFFFGETLKYFYLIFSEPNETINLDEWVVNTECHPYPIQKPTTSFSTVAVPSRTDGFVNHPGKLPAPSGMAHLLPQGTDIDESTIKVIPKGPGGVQKHARKSVH